MDEINKNLAMIRERQDVIALSKKSKENLVKSASRKEEILNNITFINTLLDENQAKMKRLTARLNTYKKEKNNLSKEIDIMKESMAAKEQEITSLKDQLASSNAKIEELNGKISEVKQVNDYEKKRADNLDVDIHRAYYTLGTSKELSKEKVVEKKGGLLGIRRTDVVNGNLDKKYFTEVDTRQTTRIPIHGKKAKLVTYHPTESYELKNENKEMAYLDIKDPDKFWGTSKYLVVEVK
jgi:chromosome segregation ATPase